MQGTAANADKLAAIAASIHDADELLELAVAERDQVLSASTTKGEPRTSRAHDSFQLVDALMQLSEP